MPHYKISHALLRDYSFLSKGKFRESDQVFFLFIEGNTKTSTKRSQYGGQSGGRSVEFLMFNAAIVLRINTSHYNHHRHHHDAASLWIL